MFALVDGNNFYVSAERIFRPSLIARPCVVLSNNDGCAIARSNEAKELGIKMGEPWFKIRHLQESAGLVALSANFELYSDISDRMMSLVAGLGHRQEIYSIDESFVDLTGIRGDLIKRARSIRERVLSWVGVPTCVGIAQTKTLAKMANHIAKQAERTPGSYPAEHAQICHLGQLPSAQLDELLAATPVSDVWGVGRKISAQLNAQGVHSALDLKRMSPAVARAGWSVIFERTVRELNGESCIDMEEMAPAKQEIACTRSFGAPVRDVTELIEAVSEFSTRAAQKLRAQGGLAGQVLVFARSSPFRQGVQYSGSLIMPLRRPSSDSMLITEAAVQGVRRIFRSGVDFAKAGVMLLDISSENHTQFELDLGAGPEITSGGMRTGPQVGHAGAQGRASDVAARRRLMAALDAVNDRFGRSTLQIGSAATPGQPRNWQMKQERRTPAYTTRWEDMPVVRA